MNSLKLALFAALISLAIAAPAKIDDGQMKVLNVADLPETIKQLAQAALEHKVKEGEEGGEGSGSSDEVITTLTNIVNTLTSINGMNGVGVDNTDVANTFVGIGNVEVVVGSGGDTVKVEIGDLVNTIGAIQGFWNNVEVVDTDVDIDSEEEDEEEVEEEEDNDDEEEEEPSPVQIDDGSLIVAWTNLLKT